MRHGVRAISGRTRRAALLIVGHGSSVAAANGLLRELARRVRARLPDRIVDACFLESARPGVAAAIDGCVRRGAGRILLVPYFLYLGGHVKRDLPKLAARARARHPGVRIGIARHLGSDPRLVALVLERARAALRSSRWT